MPVVSPEQQAAYVAQQAQQQLYADGQMQPMGTSPYISAIEQNAINATMGISNVALPAAALATTVIGSGLAEDRVMRLGSGVANFFLPTVAGQKPSVARTLGRGALMMAPSMLVLGGMSALAMTATAKTSEALIEGQRGLLATRSLMNEISAPSMSSTIYGQGSSGLSTNSAQVGKFQDFLSSVQVGTQAQTRNLVSGMNQAGLLDTRTIETTSESFRKGLSELRKVAGRLNEDLDAALQVYTSLNQMGLTNRVDRARTLTGMAAVSGATGVSMGALSQSMTQAGGFALSQGLTAQTGFTTALQSTMSAHMLGAGNRIGSDYLARVGGLEGYAARMSEISLGAVNSGAGQAMISRMFDPATGRMRDDAMENISGRRLRMSSSFQRELDPYAAGEMFQQFQDRSRSAILARVDALQMGSGTRVQRNRRQFEFLQGMGIHSGEEQLEYLNHLRAAPRAAFATELQSMQDESETAQRSVSTQARSLSGVWDRVMQNTFGDMGRSVERYGAALQVQAERAIRDATILAEGRDFSFGSTYRASMGSMEQLTRRAASGDTAFMYRDPLQELRQTLGDPSTVNLLRSSADLTGRVTTGIEARGRGRFESAVFGAYNIGFGFDRAVDTMNRRLSRRGPASTGMAARGGRFTGDSQTGIHVGTRGGEDQYATPDELLSTMALEFGAYYTEETGFARPEERALETVSNRFDGRRRDEVGRRVMRDARDERDAARDRSTGGRTALGASMLAGGSVGLLAGGFTPMSLLTAPLGAIAAGGIHLAGRQIRRDMTAVADIEGVGMGEATAQDRGYVRANRARLQDELAQGYFPGSNWTDLTPEETAMVVTIEQRRGGWMSEELFGGESSAISSEQLAANGFAGLARTSVNNVVAPAAPSLRTTMARGEFVERDPDAALVLGSFAFLADREVTPDVIDVTPRMTALTTLKSAGFIDENGSVTEGREGLLMHSLLGVGDDYTSLSDLVDAAGRSGYAADAASATERALATIYADPTRIAQVANIPDTPEGAALRTNLQRIGVVTATGALSPGALGSETAYQTVDRGLTSEASRQEMQRGIHFLEAADRASFIGVRNRQSRDSVRTLRSMNAGRFQIALAGAQTVLQRVDRTNQAVNMALRKYERGGDAEAAFADLTQEDLTALLDALPQEGTVGATPDDLRAAAALREELLGMQALVGGGEGGLATVAQYVGSNLFEGGRLSETSINELTSAGISGLEGFNIFARAQDDRRITAQRFDEALGDHTQLAAEFAKRRADVGFGDTESFLTALRDPNNASNTVATNLVRDLAMNLTDAGNINVTDSANQRENRERLERNMNTFFESAKDLVTGAGFRVVLAGTTQALTEDALNAAEEMSSLVPGRPR